MCACALHCTQVLVTAEVSAHMNVFTLYGRPSPAPQHPLYQHLHTVHCIYQPLLLLALAHSTWQLAACLYTHMQLQVSRRAGVASVRVSITDLQEFTCHACVQPLQYIRPSGLYLPCSFLITGL